MTVHCINNEAVAAAAARAGQALAPATVGRKRRPPKDPTAAKPLKLCSRRGPAEGRPPRRSVPTLPKATKIS
jgi:hypothetical protein